MIPVPRRRSLVVGVRLLLVFGAVALFGDRVPTQSSPPPMYGVRDLGTLGGTSSAGHHLGDYAHAVVGRAQTSAGQYHAFVDSLEGRFDLGTLGGAQSSASATSGGTVVGQSQTSAGQEHAFAVNLYEAGGPVMRDLGTLGGTFSAAYGVDSDIVGASRTAGNTRLQAFLYDSSARAMSALPVNRGGDSAAKGIKGSHVVGYACTSGNAACHAFSLNEGLLVSLGSLGGNSVANALNYSSQIVGSSFLAGGTTEHAFLYENGVMRDLGTLGGRNSAALGINSQGDVVGVADTAGGPHAFLWRDGVMTDLNSLLPPGSGWVLHYASGVSDGGQIVGSGTHNGVMRGYLLTPPADLSVWTGGIRSQSDSNRPRGVEVGREIRFVVSVVGQPDPITFFGARLTTTLGGPAEYVSVRRDFSTAEECQVTPTVLTCDVPPIDTVGSGGHEYQIVVRATGPGAIGHHSSVTIDSPDTDATNDSSTEENWAVALASLSLTPSTVAGGKASSARVTLTGIAPFSNDATVRLTSSRPDIAPVPATFVVPYPSSTRSFNILPRVVSAPTSVQITATYGQVTSTQTLVVLPPALSQLYLTPTTVIGGCGTSAGKIVLTGAAPAGGASIAISNTNRSATVPAVVVPAGATTKTFTVATSTVTANQVGTVTASYGGVSQALKLTVRPIRVKTLSMSPNPVKGGVAVSGTVTLECAAPSGGTVVSLSSTKSAAAAPTAPSITIPAGATTGTFSLRTSPVTASTAVTIYATAYGVRKGASLTVRP